MTARFNIDEVVKHVKTIADNNRCGTCDKLSGDRLRYPCGHTICGDCVVEANECLTCVESSKTEPVLDVVQGQLVEHVSNLLKTFQETFNIDVYRRYRLSEKLKVERQLFPECIQASVKYYNKRRSSHIPTSDDKENSFAGEQLTNSHSTTMNTRLNLVQKWLEKSEKVEKPMRKPFSDINVNRPIKSNRENKTNEGIKLRNKQNDFNKKSKKKINIETNNSTKAKHKKNSKHVLSPSLLNYCADDKIKNKSNPENRCSSDKKYDKSLKVPSDCYKHENKSDFDHLDTIVIEDTQIQVVDKDKVAWLKVVEAHNNESNHNFKDKPNRSSEKKSLPGIQGESGSGNINKLKNVYFYKRDFLFKSCNLCLRNDDIRTVRLENQRLNSNNVSITINTNSISSTITVLRDDDDCIDKVITNNSVGTQTDEGDIKVNDDEPKPYLTSSPYENISSPDLFLDDVKKYTDEKNYAEIVTENVNNNCIGTIKNSDYHCIVNDSDSDADINCSGPIKVSVDVHRPNETDGVLSTVDFADYQSRLRRSGRRRTVDSNNSSEKENLEPNRIKRPRLGKKQGLKK